MLELAPYCLTGLVAMPLVAFCFACKDDSALFGDKHLSFPNGQRRSASSEGC